MTNLILPGDKDYNTPSIDPREVQVTSAVDPAPDEKVLIERQMAIQLTLLSVALRLMFLRDRMERHRRGEVIAGEHESDYRRESNRLEDIWRCLGEENQKKVMLFAVDNSREGVCEEAIKWFVRGYGYDE